LYVKVIGRLQFAQMGSHPDISYTINIVAKFASCPHKNHYVVIKRIFNLALCYNGNTYFNLIEAYADADYASDITNIKLKTGSLFLLNHGPVT
jgi:hypothetical protein